MKRKSRAVPEKQYVGEAIRQSGLLDEFRSICRGGNGTRLRIIEWMQSKQCLSSYPVPRNLSYLRKTLGASKAQHGGTHGHKIWKNQHTKN